MIVSTTHLPPDDYVVDETIGILLSDIVLGVNFVKDWMSGFTDKLGGRSTTLEKTFTRGKEIGLDELISKAESVGADAILGLTITSNEISSEGKFMIAIALTGTAVTLRNKA